MRVSVNGGATDVHDPATVAAVVTTMSDDEQRAVAVALNGTVVPRSAWEETRLSAGDSLEVLTPTAGG